MQTAPASTVELLRPDELEAIERSWSDGISSNDVVQLFQARGVKLSEATFRKYVQLGLLPTSKRVGQKGKHRGSKGIYPVIVVRRINTIKQMMEQDMTLEQIRDSFVGVENELERSRGVMDSLFQELDRRLLQIGGQGVKTQSLGRELSDARKQAGVLLKKINQIQGRLAALDVETNPEVKEGIHD